METSTRLTLSYLFNRSITEYSENKALGFAGEKELSYRDLGVRVSELQKRIVGYGVRKGDRVAIYSQNMPEWGIAYFAITTMGAVAVPILPDFSVEEVRNILDHSESKMLFLSERMESKVDGLPMPFVQVIIRTDDLSLRKSLAPQKENELLYVPEEVLEDDLASIIYTSGTTGRSKGVMLTHKNLASNAENVLSIQAVNEHDIFLSVLPLSHTYENTLGLILPVRQGASVYYLKKPPTAAVLLPVLQEIRPTTMLTVPMIVEKIFRGQVLPKFTSGLIIRSLYSLAPVRKVLHFLAGKKLKKTFGGRVRFYGIGGAKLDPTVERFLREARFPYAIGYGLTETSPMVAGANPSQTKHQSTGPVMKGVQIRLHAADPKTGIGEIHVKGDNVMKGYYKEPELTREVFTDDGWFRTGDLGSLDKNKNLFIRGRSKTMILSSSGENIYPEDIESVINNLRYVIESLVVLKKGKLVALVHIDTESLHAQFAHMKDEAMSFMHIKMDYVRDEILQYVNSKVSKYARLQGIELVPNPFEKTPTLKIKRYLYY
ncbi:MAG: AMP-binding protein [Bacteroidales bacterium]